MEREINARPGFKQLHVVIIITQLFAKNNFSNYLTHTHTLTYTHSFLHSLKLCTTPTTNTHLFPGNGDDSGISLSLD